MNLGGRCCSELRSHHCTPAWTTRVKICLKKKREKERDLIASWFCRLYKHDANICLAPGGGLEKLLLMMQNQVRVSMSHGDSRSKREQRSYKL